MLVWVHFKNIADAKNKKKKKSCIRKVRMMNMWCATFHMPMIIRGKYSGNPPTES